MGRFTALYPGTTAVRTSNPMYIHYSQIAVYSLHVISSVSPYRRI
jgi:hypothetical protein